MFRKIHQRPNRCLSRKAGLYHDLRTFSRAIDAFWQQARALSWRHVPRPQLLDA